MIPFVKTHALGNDFLLAEMDHVPGDYAEAAKRICHRYFGVGADGLIVWKRHGSKFHLRIFNQDGSEAECSGNGLRCLAAYLMRDIWTQPEIKLETVSGVYTLRRVGDQFEADMGVPGLRPAEIPFNPATPIERVVNYPIQLEDEIVSVSACSTGNPHCSLFVDRIDEKDIQRIGPQLEHHASFPNRTNVEFIHVRNDYEVDVAFWERGVGMTYASGTGSCGATVACILNRKTNRDITVYTKAGKLQVAWPENGRLKLTSTATVVAEGR